MTAGMLPSYRPWCGCTDDNDIHPLTEYFFLIVLIMLNFFYSHGHLMDGD